MSAAPASYYDSLLDDPKNAYGLPIEESPYRELYERGAELIEPGLHICDLGCGSGRFASLVIDKAAHYWGIDFSERLITEAGRYTGRPELFQHEDFRHCFIPPADVYVLMEVLEHLDDDLGLIERLPSGSTVIASVPSFDSHSHVRVFPCEWRVRSRYATVLNMDVDIERIDLPPRLRGPYPREYPHFYLWKAVRP